MSCPNCQSTNIGKIREEENENYNKYTVDYRCNHCECEWTEVMQYFIRKHGKSQGEVP